MTRPYTTTRRTTYTRPKRINHRLHAWLTLFTGGAWGFVWLWIACSRPTRTTQVVVRTERY